MATSHAAEHYWLSTAVDTAAANTPVVCKVCLLSALPRVLACQSKNHYHHPHNQHQAETRAPAQLAVQLQPHVALCWQLVFCVLETEARWLTNVWDWRIMAER